MKTYVLASGAVLFGMAGAALAEEGSGPFSAEFSIELQSDFTYDSTDPTAEINNTFATIEGGLSFAFTDRTSVNATLLIEQVIDPTSDSFLEDHGFYAEELFFAHDFGAAQVVLGKFNPAFGSAWDAAPGIYGVDFAEDYEITERLGGAVIVPFAAANGEHELTFSVFQADRTILSDSIGTERGQNNRGAGGVSNTSSPESVALSVSGEFGSTGYNAGIQYQAKGRGDTADQTGLVFGVNHTFDGGSFPLELLAEIAWFDEFDGTSNSTTYGTLGVAAPVGPVTVSAVYSVRDVETMSTDHLATVSAEMEFFENFTGAIGYRYGRESGERNHTIGTLFAYNF
ncbi:hypothetical protein [uncultured Roseovarius sp.]|uniref:hypothetical protein n=1 Tax=uncultured Roseovarius sp. TaxID=293344 RepID=UPI00261A835B|nr:hypothetical protein [uncultured Roseovarius sp.]